MTPAEAINARLRRATGLIHRFNELDRGATAPNGSYETVVERVGLSDEWTIRLTKAPAMPEHIPFAIGDAIHNLRACLDNMVWAVVTKSGPINDERDSRRIGFPLCGDPKWFNDDGTRGVVWKYVSREVQTIIERFQPFNQEDGRRIQLLASLSNTDKHRAPIVVYQGTAGGVPFPGVTDLRPLATEAHAGALIARFRYQGEHPPDPPAPIWFQIAIEHEGIRYLAYEFLLFIQGLIQFQILPALQPHL